MVGNLGKQLNDVPIEIRIFFQKLGNKDLIKSYFITKWLDQALFEKYIENGYIKTFEATEHLKSNLTFLRKIFNFVFCDQNLQIDKMLMEDGDMVFIEEI